MDAPLVEIYLGLRKYKPRGGGEVSQMSTLFYTTYLWKASTKEGGGVKNAPNLYSAHLLFISVLYVYQVYLSFMGKSKDWESLDDCN